MKNQKLLIISILVAAVLISGSIFYYAYTTNKNKSAEPSTTTAENSVDASTQITANDIVFGNENAPVTMIEYASFTCHYCANFTINTLPKIKKDYIDTGKVKFVLRIFPPELAKAAMCFSTKENFLGFTEYIFNNIDTIFKGIENVKTEEQFITLEEKIAEKTATALKFDISALNACYANKNFDNLIQKWGEDFSLINKDGTVPTILINKKVLIGDQTYETIKATVDNFLNK